MSKYNTNPGGQAASSVGRGPTKGNDTLGGKRGEFIAEKDSYRAASRELEARLGERTKDNPDTKVDRNDLSIKPNVNVGRGPTKGNK